MSGRAFTPYETLALHTASAGLIGDLGKRLGRIRRDRADEVDIHRLRSGCRRLEALLTDLAGVSGSAGREALRVQELIHRLRKRAGGVRDADVSRELVRALASAEKWDLASRRAVRKVLNDEHRLAMARLQREARRHRTRHLPRRLKVCLYGRELPLARVTRVIAARIRRAVRLARSARADPSRLHRARLAIKRIRDLCEIAAPALGPSTRSLAARAQRLSDRLGRTQDLRVLLDVIERAEAAGSAALPGLRLTKCRLAAKHRRATASSRRALVDLDTLAAPPGSVASGRPSRRRGTPA